MNQRDDLGDQTPATGCPSCSEASHGDFPTATAKAAGSCADEPAPVAVLDAHAAVSGVAIVTGHSAPVRHGRTRGRMADRQVVAGRLIGRLATSAAPAAYLTGVKNPFGVVIGPDGALYVGDWTPGTITASAVIVR